MDDTYTFTAQHSQEGVKRRNLQGWIKSFKNINFLANKNISPFVHYNKKIDFCSLSFSNDENAKSTCR